MHLSIHSRRKKHTTFSNDEKVKVQPFKLEAMIKIEKKTQKMFNSNIEKIG